MTSGVVPAGSRGSSPLHALGSMGNTSMAAGELGREPHEGRSGSVMLLLLLFSREPVARQPAKRPVGGGRGRTLGEHAR